MLALNVTAGAALISVAAPLAQELTGVGVALGALAVSVISLFNGIGRLFWGTFSDRFGRARTVVIIFVLQVPVFTLMSEIHDFVVLLFPIAIVALCYGGGFATMPALTTDVFGPKHSGTIYGTMLTAWSAGAIAGPLFIAAVPYHSALPLIAGLLSFAAVLAMLFPVVDRIGKRRLAPSASRT
jgi:OFA family oxalate/formate antiporter-like MFS transporter